MRTPDLIVLLGISLLFWLIAIRPQSQEREAHKKLVESLAKDDSVVTTGGLHGKVVAVKDELVVLEIGKGNHVTVDKTAIARRLAAVAST